MYCKVKIIIIIIIIIVIIIIILCQDCQQAEQKKIVENASKGRWKTSYRRACIYVVYMCVLREALCGVGGTSCSAIGISWWI